MGSSQRVLEAQFARELYNRARAVLREQFCKDGETVISLLQGFGVLVGKRASSTTERGAASFVRHSRK